MKILGYEVSSKNKDVHPEFTELANPYFHKGNHIGCICVHGISCTPSTVRPVADALVKAGYTVDAPLVAGHGTTMRDLSDSTWKDWVQSIEQSYDKLKKEGCTKIFTIGHSLGGVLSAYLASEKQRPCDGAVFICPPFRMQNWLIVAMHLGLLFPYVNYPESKRNSKYDQGYPGMATRSLLQLQHLILKTRRKLKEMTCPYLAIWAALDDKVHTASSKILKKYATHSVHGEEITFMKSMHSCTFGPEKDEVCSAIVSFIQSNT